VRTHLSVLVALLAALAVAGPACGSSNPDNAATTTGGSSPAGTVAPTVSGTLTVSAAASLTEPFKKIIDEFEKANPGVEVTPTFDSSGTLSTQIQNGAPVDVFASADDATMKKLTDADLIAGTPVQFARNQLAIVVKKGNPEGVKTLEDLETVGTVSLCGAEVPCGRYADQILEQAGVTIPEGDVTRGQNAKAAFTAVSEGDADAGIVYRTDITGDKADAVVIPGDQNVIATYPIAAVEVSPLASAFIGYVKGPNGQAALQAAGFLPPA
jgi:molybdate transport system substrate-binding protein